MIRHGQASVAIAPAPFGFAAALAARVRAKHRSPWTAERADFDRGIMTTSPARSVSTAVGASRGRAGSDGSRISDPRDPSPLNGPPRDLMRADGFADAVADVGEEVASHSLIRRATSRPSITPLLAAALAADLPDDADDVVTPERAREIFGLSALAVPASAHRWTDSLGGRS